MPNKSECMDAWNLFSRYCTISTVVLLAITSPLLPYWRVAVTEEPQHTMLILLWSIVTRPLLRANPVDLPSSHDRFLIYRLLKMEHRHVRHASTSVDVTVSV